ncbi:MAG TPA: TolC family protein [Chitinophagales bacterium]|nr:TolC family protein [Chitinophagales bacterium]
MCRKSGTKPVEVRRKMEDIRRKPEANSLRVTPCVVMLTCPDEIGSDSKHLRRRTQPFDKLRMTPPAVILSLSKYLRTLFLWILCMNFFSPIHASAQTLSLQNVLDSIERNNPLLTSYQYKINADRSMAQGAKTWMPPMIGVGPYSLPYSVANDETFFNRSEGMIMYFAEQDIPNPAKLRAKENYLLSLAAIDSADIGSSRNELFTKAKITYMDRFIAEKKLRVIAEEMALLNLMIQTDTSVYSVNQSDLASIYKAQARMHALEAMRTHERSAVTEASTILNYLMNRPQMSPFAIDTAIPFHNYNLADLDTSTASVTLRRSDILKIDRSISSLQLNSALALTARKPDFNVRFEHYDVFGGRNAFSLMGSVTIPIAPWASKSYKSEALSIQQQIDAMHFEKRNSINEARSMMQQSLLHTISEYEEVNHYEKEVLPAYKKAFQTSLLSYRENTNGLLPSLMSWDDLIMAETEYLYHLEQAYKSEIAYENAIEKK